MTVLPLVFALAARADDRMPMAAGLRYRSLWVPDAILETWYFTEDEGAIEERPSVGASVWGAEFALEPGPDVYLFYLEYISARMDDGYWDDREDPPQHDDGDWLEPQGLGAIVLGANYGHEITLTSQDKDAWLGLLVGGGLGAGVSVGEVDRWKAGLAVTGDPDRCGLDEDAIARAEHCDPDDSPGIWPVVPMVDISVAARLHVGEHALARIDLGLHDTLFAGTALAGRF